jgi:hypothetical protein
MLNRPMQLVSMLVGSLLLLSLMTACSGSGVQSTVFYCDHASITYTNSSTGGVLPPVSVAVNGTNIATYDNLSVQGPGTFTADIGYPLQPNGTAITITFGGGILLPISGSCSGNPSFFNGGDNRVDGKPGDRVAIYCNPTGSHPYIDVWGILDDSTGKRLGWFDYATLKAHNGGGSITSNMGTVNIAVYPDKKVVVQWFDGPAYADGHGDFRKIVTCDFSTATSGK